MWAAAALASESGRSMHAASQVTSKAPPPWSARGFRHLAAKVALEHSFSLRSYPALPMIDYTLDSGRSFFFRRSSTRASSCKASHKARTHRVNDSDEDDGHCAACVAERSDGWRRSSPWLREIFLSWGSEQRIRLLPVAPVRLEQSSLNDGRQKIGAAARRCWRPGVRPTTKSWGMRRYHTWA
jgi:hypothetical protein